MRRAHWYGLLVASAAGGLGLARGGDEAAQETPEQPTSITFDVSRRGALLNVQRARVVAEVHDPERPLRSFVEIDVAGGYEGNICSDDSVGIDVQPRTQADGTTEGDLYLRRMALKAPVIDLEQAGCLLFSHPRTFVSRLRIRVQRWEDGDRARSWSYAFRGAADQVLASLLVDYHVASGWHVRLARGED